MQRGVSASQAARENGISFRTLKKHAKAALIQDHPGGRIRARKSNRLSVYLQVPGPRGPIEIEVHGSKVASEFARYKAAINRFLAGDRKALDQWRGKQIAGLDLISDPEILIDQADKGLLPYSLYSSLSGGAA